MKNQIIQIMEKMNQQLSAVSESNTLQTITQKLNITKEMATQLKAYILNSTFKDKAEEIEFFKIYKPQIYGELLYYKQLWELEISLPLGKKGQGTFYKAELTRSNDFLDRKRSWVTYYRTGANHLDEMYFLRNGTFDDPTSSSQLLTADTRFCTIGSIVFSQITSTEKLVKELEKRIGLIDNNNEDKEEGATSIMRRLKWKGPKVGLVELGYAFKEAGALDESLREIFACFEEFFSIKLDNTPRIFQEIISRKKDEAVYLSKLATMMKNRVERMNENYKPKK